MTAYHLLLCVVDYVYTALEQISTNSPYTTTGNLHRLLNPAFGLEIFSLKKLQWRFYIHMKNGMNAASFRLGEAVNSQSISYSTIPD
jgi:hypothetical protein